MQIFDLLKDRNLSFQFTLFEALAQLVGRSNRTSPPSIPQLTPNPLATAGENFSASLICPRQIRSADRHLKMPPGSRLSPTLSFMEFRPSIKFGGASSLQQREKSFQQQNDGKNTIEASPNTGENHHGALAQLVARYIRIVEVSGSNPLCSTKPKIP